MGITAGVGALIGGIGSLAGGAVGAIGASDAASTQANAANNAAALQAQEANNSLNFSKLQYGNSLNLLAPYYNTGVSANSRLAYLMGLNPNQGLPPGVVNPNAPQAATSAGPLAGISTPNTGSGGVQTGSLPMNRPFQNPSEDANNNTGSLANLNALSNQNTAQGGTAGIQPGVIKQPGLQTDPTNPTGITGGPINVGQFQAPGTVTGQPGQVPIQGGNTINQGGSAQVPMVNGSGTATPGAPGTTAPGGFGSLAQGWDQTFSSPTTVNEQNDPGYMFRLQQGQTALENSAAARGNLLTGGTAKAETDFAQNDASNEYQNVYNRSLQNYNTNYNTFTNDQTNTFNRLSALSGTGQVSANNLSSAGLATANNIAGINANAGQQIGQNINNAGAANASGYIGGANAINGGITGLSSSLNNLALLQALQAGGGGGVLPPGDPSICWIAEALYGVDDSRTHLMRSWMKKVVRFHPIGQLFFNAYLKYGERVAEIVKRKPLIRAVFRKVFDTCLVHALKWEAAKEARKPIEDFQGLEYQR